MILVLSQNKPIQFLLNNLFKRRFGSIQVNHSSAAISAVKSMPSIQMVIVDLDGETESLAAFARYVGQSALFDLPLIIIGNEKSIQGFQMQTAFDHRMQFFAKPFSPKQLLEGAESVLAPLKEIHTNHLLKLVS